MITGESVIDSLIPVRVWDRIRTVYLLVQKLIQEGGTKPYNGDSNLSEMQAEGLCRRW